MQLTNLPVIIPSIVKYLHYYGEVSGRYHHPFLMIDVVNNPNAVSGILVPHGLKYLMEIIKMALNVTVYTSIVVYRRERHGPLFILRVYLGNIFVKLKDL